MELPHRESPRRRSLRLKGYDYTQPGAYFITLCTHAHAHLFGRVVDGEMRLNEAGRVVEQCWNDIPNHFPNVVLDQFVVMPNHVHGILIIARSVGANHYSPLQVNDDSPLRVNDDSPLRVNDDSPLHRDHSRPRGTSKTIGAIIRGFKIGVTKWFRQHTTVHTVWQRNYYEHIIRDAASLHCIRQYIAQNPMRWQLDRYHSEWTGDDPLAREAHDIGRPAGRSAHPPQEEDAL